MSSCDEVSHPLRSCECGTSEQAHVKTTTESKKVNIKVCINSLSLSLLMTSYLLCLAKEVDSVDTLFLSTYWLQKSVVVTKHLY